MPVLRFKPIDHYDGTYRDRIWMSGDTVIRKRSQPLRKATMEVVKDIRDHGELKKQPESSMGRWTLSIPKSDYWNLVAINPDLHSPDHDIMNRAWRKFSASAESLPYRVNQGVLA